MTSQAISRSLVSVALLSSFGLVHAQVVLPQQCYGTPHNQEDLATDPIWISVCVPLGRLCSVPPAPQVSQTFVDRFSRKPSSSRPLSRSGMRTT